MHKISKFLLLFPEGVVVVDSVLGVGVVKKDIHPATCGVLGPDTVSQTLSAEAYNLQNCSVSLYSKTSAPKTSISVLNCS